MPVHRVSAPQFDAASWSDAQRQVALAMRLATGTYVSGFVRVVELAKDTKLSERVVRATLRELEALGAAVEVKRGAWALRPEAERASRKVDG